MGGFQTILRTIKQVYYHFIGPKITIHCIFTNSYNEKNTEVHNIGK